MISHFLKCSFFLLTFVFFGCSDQPKQIDNQNFVVPNPSSPSTPIAAGEGGVGTFGVDDSKGRVTLLDNVYGRKPTEIREPRFSDDNSDDDKIEVNGKKPIFFNGVSPLESSVAGVKFDMSHSEATAILSTPYVGACGSSGDYYLENLCMLWSSEEPRRLRQVLILDGYLGAIILPEPLGRVTMKAELQDKFTPDQGALGEELLIKTYNQFFEKAEGYSCLDTKDCQAVLYNDYINWILPNITIVFSKDRKVLIQMIINQDVQPGDFANPLDLIKGEIKVEETGKVLKIGDAWGTVQGNLSKKADPPSILETTDYRKDFVGMLARVKRTGVFNSPLEFSLIQKEPSDEDVFSDFTVYSNYTQPILLNGKYVELVKDGEGVKAVLTTVKPEPAKMLSVRMDALAGNIDLQKSVLTQLAQLIHQEFQTLGSDIAISQRISGLNAKNAPNRRMVVRTSFYDFSKKEGMFAYVSISSNTGGMVFASSLDNNPLSEGVMKYVKKPVDITTTELAGVKLGQKIKIAKFDRNRNEAFATINGQTVRVSVDLDVSIKMSFEDDVVDRQKMVEISGVPGLGLGVYPFGYVDQDTTSFEAEVGFMSSSINSKGIDNICGLKGLVFEIGMTQKAFKNQLIKTLRESKKACSFFIGSDESGVGEARTYYFPNDQVKIYFIEKVLAGVQKYKKASGGN